MKILLLLITINLYAYEPIVDINKDVGIDIDQENCELLHDEAEITGFYGELREFPECTGDGLKEL